MNDGEWVSEIWYFRTRLSLPLGGAFPSNPIPRAREAAVERYYLELFVSRVIYRRRQMSAAPSALAFSIGPLFPIPIMICPLLFAAAKLVAIEQRTDRGEDRLL